MLRDLAFMMMSNRTFDLLATQAVESIGRSLAPATSLSPASFLDNVCANGLLVESEYGAYSFAHPTFQEYLAAAAVTDEARKDVLVGNVGSTWWRETTLLYSARAGAGVVVAAALASGQLDALTVAVECADADRRLDPALRERLNALLVDAHNPDASAERRRLAAALTATRELGKTLELADGTRVCAAPVTRRLYELFTYQKNDEFPVRPFAGLSPAEAGAGDRRDGRRGDRTCGMDQRPPQRGHGVPASHPGGDRRPPVFWQPAHRAPERLAGG